MANSKQKIFHLEMEGEHYYFGSPKAIFDVIGPERMGMKYTSFHSNITLKPGDVYKSRRRGWIIRVGLLEQAKTNRGFRRNQSAVEDVLPKEETELKEELATTSVEMSSDTMDIVFETPDVVELHEPVESADANVPTTPEIEEKSEVTHAEIAPKRNRKKKSNDVPEQLTLF